MKRIRMGTPDFPYITAILLLLGGAATDLFSPQPYMGLPLLSATPLVAAALLPFRASLSFAVLACVTSVALDLHLGRPMVALSVDLADIVVTGVLALAINRILSWQNRRLARVRDVAEAAQRAVLPAPPPYAGPVAVAARYVAAQAEARIGGDLYAVQSTPFGVRAIVGDARGKGMQAVSSVSVIVGAFRHEAQQAPTLGDLARRLDGTLSRESDRQGTVGGFEDFTTAVLVQIPPDGAEVQLVNCGHPAPYLVEKEAVTRLEPTDHELPLGLGFPETEADRIPASDVFPLRPGASLLLVTDGVTEARDKDGAFYDPCTQLTPRTYTHPGRLVDDLVRNVFRWTGSRNQDDMAILAFTRIAGPQTTGRKPGTVHRDLSAGTHHAAVAHDGWTCEPPPAALETGVKRPPSRGRHPSLSGWVGRRPCAQAARRGTGLPQGVLTACGGETQPCPP
jgi:serine phosphatase RsbU (regulator of sigma subunit)